MEACHWGRLACHTNRCLTRWTSFKNRRLLRVSFSAKFRKQRKIRKGKSRCRKPSRQKIYDSGKSKNTNFAVENRAGRGIMTAGNWIMQIPLWWRGILWVKASEIKKSADPDAHFDNFRLSKWSDSKLSWKTKNAVKSRVSAIGSFPEISQKFPKNAVFFPKTIFGKNLGKSWEKQRKDVR